MFESVAQHIAATGEHRVTLVGSGRQEAGRAYNFIHVPAVSRDRFERWPKMPFARHEFMYEEATFATRLALLPEVATADVTMTCSFPYVNWALRRPRSGGRPPHVFVTQNGDWGPQRNGLEPRFFDCEGLICTNPVYFERQKQVFFSRLIPNGIDPARFMPGPSQKQRFGWRSDLPVVLMVSALEPGKRVIEAIRAMADVPHAQLVVAGDGPLRDEVSRLAEQLLPGRFTRGTYRHDEMPALYRSADVFLHTKILESFGNVYIEALACGIPVVAHDDPVTRWILGDFGRRVDTNNRPELSAAIRNALQHDDVSEDAADWARTRYAWPVVAQQYADFLSEVAHRSRQKSGSGPLREAPMLSDRSS
ncbi:glycosyltransferase family 4 protein [Sphingomonas sp. KRR8]|uniref:glycosyltransferase family 4 protein n=1 Tax=Sphingomonas sp. KRR8 TaxID=2942996 RepID=UPI002020636D|nr:glycosyltransferase family 4 protein [Sphingomonas sp. KRR8]URD61548.1 glycosyltransferase family 4 protein [Sphingomonas sp. KRR8]